MNKHIVTALQALENENASLCGLYDGVPISPSIDAKFARIKAAIRYLSHLTEITRDPDGDDPLGLHAQWLTSVSMSTLAAIEKLLDGSATPATNSMVDVFLTRARADAPEGGSDE